MEKNENATTARSVKTIVVSPGTDIEVRKERTPEGMIATCILRSRPISSLDRLLEEVMGNAHSAAILKEIEDMPLIKGSTLYLDPSTGDHTIRFTGAETLRLLRSV